MNTWLKTIDKFLDEWKNKVEFEGAILSGSYAVHLQTDHSDIDLMIVLSGGTKFWQRGSIEIDGYLIEYIADPIYFWKKAFYDEYSSRRKVSINMFAIGEILHDKNGLVKKLKRQAESLMRKSFEKMSQRDIEMAKYHIRDDLLQLQDSVKGGFVKYAPLYYLQLSKILNSYASFLGLSLPAPAKLHQFLNDENFRQKYKLSGFSDQIFIDLVNKSFNNFNTTRDIEELTNYVINKMGGFDITC